MCATPYVDPYSEQFALVARKRLHILITLIDSHHNIAGVIETSSLPSLVLPSRDIYPDVRDLGSDQRPAMMHACAYTFTVTDFMTYIYVDALMKLQR